MSTQINISSNLASLLANNRNQIEANRQAKTENDSRASIEERARDARARRLAVTDQTRRQTVQRPVSFYVPRPAASRNDIEIAYSFKKDDFYDYGVIPDPQTMFQYLPYGARDTISTTLSTFSYSPKWKKLIRQTPYADANLTSYSNEWTFLQSPVNYSTEGGGIYTRYTTHYRKINYLTQESSDTQGWRPTFAGNRIVSAEFTENLYSYKQSHPGSPWNPDPDLWNWEVDYPWWSESRRVVGTLNILAKVPDNNWWLGVKLFAGTPASSYVYAERFKRGFHFSSVGSSYGRVEFRFKRSRDDAVAFPD